MSNLNHNDKSDVTNRTTFHVVIESGKRKKNTIRVGFQGKQNKIMWFNSDFYTDRDSMSKFICNILSKSISKKLKESK